MVARGDVRRRRPMGEVGNGSEAEEEGWVGHTKCGSDRGNRRNPGPGLRTVQYSSIPMADVDTR